MIVVFGHKGNMGRRYTAILDLLFVKWIGCEAEDFKKFKCPEDTQGVIIATPTETHLDIIKKMPVGMPILCEKPICKDIKALEELLKRPQLNLRMIDQYRYAMKLSQHEINQSKITFWSFYNSGKDSLPWDCINIIRDSDKLPVLKNTSPRWECSIDGIKLNLNDMNEAYIEMIRDWLYYKSNNHEYILKSHKNVERYIDCYGYSSNCCNTSKVK